VCERSEPHVWTEELREAYADRIQVRLARHIPNLESVTLKRSFLSLSLSLSHTHTHSRRERPRARDALVGGAGGRYHAGGFRACCSVARFDVSGNRTHDV
jgi:hypothetical protein